MNHFSIEVSKALREIGEEGEEAHFIWSAHTTPETLWCIHTFERKFSYDGRQLPAYTLHDILRLMPKIGEKMGWGRCCLRHAQHSASCQPSIAFSVDLTTAFLENDYPAAEKYLLEIITKK